MKKIFKRSNIFSFLLGALIFTGITSVAAYSIFATDIGYTPSDSTWKKSNGEDITNVKDAIDELYTKANGSSICKKLSGNKNAIGSKYVCDPGDGIYRIFYILKTSEDTVDLLMDRNITQATSKTIYTYTEAMTYFTSGLGKPIIDSWNNTISVSLPDAEDIAHASNYSEWTLQNDSSWFYFESHNNTTANNSGTYAWLYDYLNDCSSAKCHNSLGGNEASGYWTKNLLYSDNSQAKGVYKTGTLTQDLISNNARYGVRPVITMKKSQLN